MWKKALWVYLALYVVGGVGYFIFDAVKLIGEGTFSPVSIIFLLVLLLPVVVLASALRKGKANILLILFSLLIVAVPLAGILRFNDMELATIGKALIFVPMLVGLIYYGYRRIFVKA